MALKSANLDKLSKSELLFLAKTAEQCERYDHMTSYIERLVELGHPLDSEERSLLSAAAKSLIGPYRKSNRLGENVEPTATNDEPELLLDYRKRLQESVESVANRVVRLIDNFLLPKVGDDTAMQVYYMKMKADYLRYVAESVLGRDSDAVEKARKCYKDAYELSVKQMDQVHPGRLGLALNWSVFQYEIENSPESAIELATNTIAEASNMLKKLDRDSFRESAMIVQLLRDNLQLWEKSGEGIADGATNDVEKTDTGNTSGNGQEAQPKEIMDLESNVGKDKNSGGEWPEVIAQVLSPK